MNNIKLYRDRLGISQIALANKLNISQQAITKWEAGEAMPRADKLPQLAKIFGCTIDELFTFQSAP